MGANPVPATPTLFSVLLRRAELAAEEPWLFRSEGLDWRWHSWGDLARQASAWAGHLAGHPAGSRVEFPYRPGPESIALDLGIQGAGLVSVSVSGGGEAAAEPGRAEPLTCRPDPPLQRQEGGAVVQIEGSPVVLAAAEMMAVAERLQAEIAPARRTGEREIVVLGGPLEMPEERAMLSWATATGAAVALEPSPALRAATAAWVRPTVFHGTAEEIGVLRAWAAVKKKGGLPFGRLRTVLVAGGDLGDEDAAFWRQRGVKLGRVPPLAAERHKHGI